MRGQSYAIPLCMMCKKRTICNLIPPPGRRTTTEKPAKTQNCCLCANFLLFCYLRLYKNVTINVKVLIICMKYCFGHWNCVPLQPSNQEFPDVICCTDGKLMRSAVPLFENSISSILLEYSCVMASGYFFVMSILGCLVGNRD